MRRTIIILIGLFCLVFINSCTTENRSEVPTEPEVKTEESETKGSEVENKEEPQEETAGDVQEVIPATEEQLNEPRAGEVGEKQITISIVDRSGNKRDETITTEAGDLLTALEESGLGSASDENSGYITTVGGVTADLSNYEWWDITKNGQPLPNASDQTAITNGETYVFTLKGPQ